jgi:beta-glucosidase
VRIRNTGLRPGKKVVQLYLHDVVASVARPVKQLTGFARVGLAAGQAQEVSFAVHPDRTAFTNREFQRIVEPGDIEVLVGTSAMHLLPGTGSADRSGGASSVTTGALPRP